MDFTQTIWNDNSYQAYIEYLKSLADDKYKEFNSKITPISNESQIYGVRVPKMRDTAKLIAKGSFRAFLDYVDALDNKSLSHEEISIYGMVIGYAKLPFGELCQRIRTYASKVNNWACCDCPVSSFKEIKKYIDKYVLGEDKEAHVSTSSFYRHYKDKYDVMNDNYKRILDQYMHSSQNHNYEDVFINLFNMSKELHYLKNAFDYTGINSLGDFIYQYSYNTFIEMCKIKNIQFEDKDLLLLDVFCGGASIMYQHYILGKFDLSPQQAGKILYQMFPDVFKISW